MKIINIRPERRRLAAADSGIINRITIAPGVHPITEHRLERQTDWPDIDFDCLPYARDGIKDYAAQTYGGDKVCSVGTWLTYKFRSALQDVVRAYGGDTKEVILLTTNLPDDVDELKDGGYAPCVACKTRHREVVCPKCGSEEIDGVTIGSLIAEHSNLAAYNSVHPDIVEMAVRLVGKIKSMGTHAGGLIISSVPLFGNIPMALIHGKWTSMWTEGRNTQLSKFGYIKWDVLGLQTLQYIDDCCKMIEKTRGYKFDTIPWIRQDKNNNIFGRYNDKDGAEHCIMMDDKEVFQTINDLRTETIFQFETDVQRGILRNGVRDYYDLMIYSSMGHPGPIQHIPDYVERRDDKHNTWMQGMHPDMLEILRDTRGLVVYQEQYAALLMKLAGFTAPEAEAARKAVAKKWKEKLKPVEHKWIVGASKTLGEQQAIEYFKTLTTFCRYAFNKSHACSYIAEAYMTAWLKTHFAPEWWASVMSSCHPDKLAKYMNVARSEGVKFSDIDVENMSKTFAVDPVTLTITPGLIGIKGIGPSLIDRLKLSGKYNNIDDFVSQNCKSKTLIERLIKLGAFQKYHGNAKATWMWYQYKYCGDVKELKKEIKDKLLVDWTPEKIEKERERQISEFKALHPKRKKIPPKILKWNPKPDDCRERVMALYPDDFTLRDRLKFEKEYLGYYWHTPMDLYVTTGGRTIKDAKEGGNCIECVIEGYYKGNTKKGTEYVRLTVSDGVNTGVVLIWSDDVKRNKSMAKPGYGVRLRAQYDPEYDSFSLERGSAIILLDTKENNDAAPK